MRAAPTSSGQRGVIGRHTALVRPVAAPQDHWLRTSPRDGRTVARCRRSRRVALARLRLCGQDRRGGHRLFHVAGDFCYPDPRPEPDPDKLFLFYRPLGQDTVAFSGEIGQTRYVFDRLADLPPACTAQRYWTPPRIAALVAATFAELYPSFDERGIDWRARMAAVERALEREFERRGAVRQRSNHAGGDRGSPCRAARRGGAASDASWSPAMGLTIAAHQSAGDPRTAVQDWVAAYQRGVLDVVLQGNGRQRGARSHLLGTGRRYRLSECDQHVGLFGGTARRRQDRARRRAGRSHRSLPGRPRRHRRHHLQSRRLRRHRPAYRRTLRRHAEGWPTPRSASGAQGVEPQAVPCRAVRAGSLCSAPSTCLPAT